MSVQQKTMTCFKVKENGERQIIQGGARNVITLNVHVTHFYYYKNI